MGAGFESTIDIYLRVRPIVSGATALYEVDAEEGNVKWTIPRHGQLGVPNHQREHYSFKFTGIFDTESKQDEVFQKVAHKVVVGSLDGYNVEQVVVGSLDGYNGTIFAYGQTGSGKTYTITGGAERYVDRGIIPRAISLIFGEVAERSEYTYTLHFSYLEIYNETGYDLLNPDHETKRLEDLPKVTLLEDEGSVFHLRNLSQHLATNEEEALNLLFMGDTNRTISSTPMNMASSRSHCIFTAHILACKAGEDMVRKSKLNLVDLAGSERVWKSGVDGQILREAKYINLSLHFLEQVIVALQERCQGITRNHIPYRNSMMTSVLRDSIGGNCRTVMIATVTISQEQLEETISTCRFAQRVAMVSNQVVLNEEVDPNLVIKRLKQQVRDLKEELNILRGENEERPPLTSSEIETIRSQVSSFVNDTTLDSSLHCGASMMQIRAAFQIFKEILNSSDSKLHQDPECYLKANSGPVLAMEENIGVKALQARINDLSYQLQQRDNEIQILVAFIRKREAAAMAKPSSRPSSRSEKIRRESNGRENQSEVRTASPGLPPRVMRTPERKVDERKVERDELSTDAKEMAAQPAEVESCCMDRKAAFDLFLKNYDKMDAIEENKVLLKTMYAEAKVLGEKVNHARESINELKAKIERHRVERARNYLVSSTEADVFEPDPEEDHLVSLIDVEKRDYKQGFSQLRDLKKEIEHLHKLLEQSRVRLQADFELYLSAMARPHLEPTLVEAMTKSSSSPTEVIPRTLQRENSADVGRVGTNSPHIAENLQHRKPVMMPYGGRELGQSSSKSNGMSESKEASAAGSRSRSRNDGFCQSSRESGQSRGGRENVEVLGTAFTSQKQGLGPSSRKLLSLSNRRVDDTEASDVLVSAQKGMVQPELGRVTNVVSQGWCNSSMGATDATPFKHDNCSDLRGLESTRSLNSAAFSAQNLRPSSGLGMERGVQLSSSEELLRNASAPKPPILLTGNASTDADILAFYKARSGILVSP